MFKKIKQLSGYQWFLIVFCFLITALCLNVLLGVRRLEHGGSSSHVLTECDLHGHSDLVFHEASPEHLYSDGYSVDCWECSVCHRLFSNESCSLEVSAFLPALYSDCLSIHELISGSFSNITSTSVGVVVSRYVRADEHFLIVSDLVEPVAVKIKCSDFMEGDILKIKGVYEKPHTYYTDFKSISRVEKLSSVDLSEFLGSHEEYCYLFDDEEISSTYSSYFAGALTICVDDDYQAIVDRPTDYFNKLICISSPYISWSSSQHPSNALRFGPTSERLSTSREPFYSDFYGQERYFVFTLPYLELCYPDVAFNDNFFNVVDVPGISHPAEAPCNIFGYLAYSANANTSLDFVIVAVDSSGYGM